MRNNIEGLTQFKTPEDSPGYLLWRVSTKWRNAIENVLKPLDLTHPQFVILATTGWLTRNKETITQIDISKSSGLDPNTTSQILRGLEIKGFIKRIKSVDERSKNPELTSLGYEKLTKALPAVESADKKYFDLLDLDELQKLINIFKEFS